jgi:hypothetical protein
MCTDKEIAAGAAWLMGNRRLLMDLHPRSHTAVAFERARKIARGILEAGELMKPMGRLWDPPARRDGDAE